MRTNIKGAEEGEKRRRKRESLVAASRGVCEKWKRLKVGQQQPASSESGEEGAHGCGLCTRTRAN